MQRDFSFKSYYRLKFDKAAISPLKKRKVRARGWRMTQLQGAKDLLKRAVELDSAQRYSEARICYEEGIHNLLRCMKGQCGRTANKKERRRGQEGRYPA